MLKYVINDKIDFRNYGDIVVAVVRGYDDGVFEISESARLMLEAFTSPKSKNELIDILLSKYDCSKEEVTADLNQFIDYMLELRLIKEYHQGC